MRMTNSFLPLSRFRGVQLIRIMYYHRETRTETLRNTEFHSDFDEYLFLCHDLFPGDGDVSQCVCDEYDESEKVKTCPTDRNGLNR